MKKRTRLFSIALLLALLTFHLIASLPAPAEPLAALPEGTAVVLATGGARGDQDVYAALAARKAQLTAGGHPVITADAGDALAPSDREAIARMNAASYDLAVPGRLEWSGGYDAFLDLREVVKFPYVSANIKSTKTRDILLPSTKAFQAGALKIAFVGVTTPGIAGESPESFLDNSGYPRCTFSPEALDATVQSAVDSARGKGADVVVLLGYLDAEGPWSAQELIVRSRGLDAAIVATQAVPGAVGSCVDVDGRSVICLQPSAGSIGALIVATDGSIRAEMLPVETSGN